MAHYIDKDALVAEIDRLENKLYYEPENFKDVGAKMALDSLKSSLDTLEVKEVNLEHEVESYWKQCDMTWCRDAYRMTHIRSMLSDIAKHFFELGLNTQHNSINIPNIDNILEESGIDPFSKEAKIFKESYYMGLGKFKAQKGE